MNLDRKTVAGLVAAVVLTVVATLFGPDAVSLVRDAVSTAPVTSQVQSAPVGSDTAPVESRQ